MVTWIGICTQWFTLPSVREGIEKLSFPKVWAPEAPELDCRKVFLRIEGPHPKVGGWAGPAPEMGRGLPQGRRDSNRAVCMYPWRGWLLHD